MLVIHAGTQTAVKYVTLDEIKKKKKIHTHTIAPRTNPKVSSDPCLPPRPLPLTFFSGTSPLTEKMDVVALYSAAFRGPGWIACKRGDWFQCSPWTKAFGVW